VEFNGLYASVKQQGHEGCPQTSPNSLISLYPGGKYMPKNLKQATFAKQVNTEFQVHDSAAKSFKLKLAQVVKISKTAQQEAFSLLFQGPATHYIAQGIHKLNHAQLGEIDIFLVPVGKNQDGFEYEAIFNHLIKPKQKNPIPVQHPTRG
jgi:hypothetical protein